MVKIDVKTEKKILEVEAQKLRKKENKAGNDRQTDIIIIDQMLFGQSNFTKNLRHFEEEPRKYIFDAYQVKLS